MTAMVYTPITLLNASYEPLSHRVTLQKAARLLSLGKAIVHEADPSGRVLREWPWPKVLRLTYFVKVAYNKIYGPASVSKRGVLIRDSRRCAFCLKEATTVDHIHPRSRGGEHTWMNLISACQPCNNKKANRTPAEAGMKLLFEPRIPNRMGV